MRRRLRDANSRGNPDADATAFLLRLLHSIWHGILHKPGAHLGWLDGDPRQNAVFSLNGPINFTADQQQVYTQNSPTDSSRALLNVNGHFGAAVKGKNHSGIQLRNVRINGNRPTFGYLSGAAGEALIELGGNGASQVFSYLDVKEPQGWSCLHLIGGSTVSCTGATVTHNTIGPAGQPDGTWADGLSIECRNTEVAYNTITDATDGAIVIFSSPGSHVHDNTVIAATRTLLGGIHMVGTTYGGDYTGTLVSNNTINAQGALIKVAVPMGPRVWGCGQTATIFGGTVTMNTLIGAHMGYGFAVDGVSNWTVTGNVDQSTHTGTPGAQSCNSSPPGPAGFQKTSIHAQGTFQNNFIEGVMESLLGLH